MLKAIALKLSLLLLVCGLSVTAFAMADDLPHALDIPSGKLSNALALLARQSGVELMYRPDQVRDIKTRGAKGNLTAHDAALILLQGTSLELRTEDSGALLVIDPSKSRSNSTRAATQVPGDGNGDASKEDGKNASPGFRVAQASSGQSPDAVSIERHSPSGTDQAPEALQEVVVTAQKREENLRDVPISISVLSGKELDRSAVQGVADALNTIPGVATQQNYLGGGTVVVVRGVAPSFPTLGGSNPVAYYLDAVPFGGVHNAIVPDANAFDLSRVEVLRGPQGTLYGASALNGVVRILTNDANLMDFDLKARVLGSATQYGGGNYRGDFAVNVPIIPGKLAARAVVGYENNSGWIDQPNKKDVNDTQRKTYRLKLNAHPIEDLSVALSAWRSDEDSGAPPVGYRFDKDASTLPQPTRTDYDAYSAKIDYELPGITISSATSYLDYQNVGNVALDVEPFFLPNLIFYNRINANVLSEELGLRSDRQGVWRWSVGGIYRRATDNTTQYYYSPDQPLPPPVPIHETSNSNALFGELTRLFFADRLELTAGIRHYHENISQLWVLLPGLPPVPGNSISEANTPRVIAAWHPNDSQMLFASYSQGFRGGIPQEPAAGELGFPAVRPDRLRNYEVGSKGSIAGGRVAYDASVYYMDWSGIQQQLGVPAPADLHYPYPFVVAEVNGQGASGVGVDLALSARITDSLTIGANVSWNDLTMNANVLSQGVILFRKGDRPTSSPETTAGVSAQYSLLFGDSGYKGTLAASANYTSSQDYRGLVGATGTDLQIQSGDPMFLSRASFTLESPERQGHWSATVFVDNLNNERGAPVKAFITVPNWDTRIRPRTAGLQFDYRLH